MDDSNISTKALLTAGGVATVVLLGAAWWYAAATSERVAEEARQYAEQIESEAEASAVAALDAGTLDPAAAVAALDADITDDVVEAGERQDEISEDMAKVVDVPSVEVAEAPAEEAPAEEVAEAPAEEAPAEEVAEAPAEEAPAEEVAQAPAEEAPAEEVAEAPAEEAPAEEVAEAPAEEAPAAAAAIDVAALPGDATKGARVFNKCKACHVVESEQNRTGPHLVGILGRTVGAVEGYSYSDALQAAAEAGDVWTPDMLNAWLENSGAVYPGNKMAYKLRREGERDDVIAYLATFE